MSEPVRRGVLAAIDAFVAAAVGGATVRGGVEGVGIVAVGWATVDQERLTDELGASPAGRLADDELLGARCDELVLAKPEAVARRADATLTEPAALRLLLVEPITEWRLAATLARHGEGPAAVWITGRITDRVARSKRAAGPFGRERLLLGGATTGPHVLVLDDEPGREPADAGTIEP